MRHAAKMIFIGSVCEHQQNSFEFEKDFTAKPTIPKPFCANTELLGVPYKGRLVASGLGEKLRPTATWDQQGENMAVERTEGAITSTTDESRPLAVITGASSGIGYELARVFATHGYDLVVCSGSEKIRAAAQEFESMNTNVSTVQADLATSEGVQKLWEWVQNQGRPVDVVAINAGVGVGGDFARETNLNDELNMIQLNVTSTVHLAKLALPDMVRRGSGRILFTSSIAGTMPTPLEAVYGATKAFVLSFAQSLRHELKDTGVTITALQPGPTNTDFFRRAGMENTEVGSEGKYTNDPHEVAVQGYEALMAGDDHVYASSVKTKVQGELGKFIPKGVKAKQHQKMAQPKKAKAAKTSH